MYLQPTVGHDILSLGASPLDAQFVRQYNDVAVDVESDFSSSDDSDHNSEASDDDSDQEIDDEIESSSDNKSETSTETSSDGESDLSAWEDIGITNVQAIFIYYSLAGVTHRPHPRKRRRR